MSLEWLDNAFLEEERRGGIISKEEWEFSRGCNLNVILSFNY